jgi:hypothetical protein
MNMPTSRKLAIRTGLIALVSLGLWAGARQLRAQQLAPDVKPVPALSPFMDVHTHMTPGDPEGSVRLALAEMPNENSARLVFMPSPFIAEDKIKFDVEYFAAPIQKHPDKLAFLGGGGTLNVMIMQAVKSGDAGPEVEKKFREQAEALLRAGAIGFGEMTAEHLPSAGSPNYQSAPPDHPLFLLLADIAAQHNVPINMHMEALPETIPLPAGLKSPPNPPSLPGNIAAFERLLAHNPRANIVWAHAGSTDNTGFRTPDLCRRLLAAHPNLFMELKIDPLNIGKNPLTDANGKLKPEWLKLFQDYPDRFLIGSDQFYSEPPPGPQRWVVMVQLFNQLPADLRRKIGMDNPQRIYFGKHS